MKKYYVAGFLFSADYKSVALVRKNKPAWQKGRLNGIGGKIELLDDSPKDAMRREFKEEAGLDIKDWEEFMKMEGDDFIVYFFKATGDVWKVKTMEEEEIEVWSLNLVLNDNSDELISNLKWVIPIALEKNVTATIKYN